MIFFPIEEVQMAGRQEVILEVILEVRAFMAGWKGRDAAACSSARAQFGHHFKTNQAQGFPSLRIRETIFRICAVPASVSPTTGRIGSGQWRGILAKSGHDHLCNWAAVSVG